MIDQQQLLYAIALTQVEGVGSITAKNLIAHCGDAKSVFTSKQHHLTKIPGIGRKTAKALVLKEGLKIAERELNWLEKNNCSALYYLDEAYPERLKNCEDGPIILYQKGETNLNANRVLAIVGTRNATDYGKKLVEQFCRELVPYNPLVISGLAYGTDINAHKGAIKNNLKTIGVLAHGLDKIYPNTHARYALKMMEQGGGVLTEFTTKTNPDRENFPKRNRIIAGICDAVIVVEAAKKGGALITAQIANSYNRDVFAFPGRVGDAFSEGTNNLIKQNQAALINSVKDLEYILNWEKSVGGQEKVAQAKLFAVLTEDQRAVIRVMERYQNEMGIEAICMELKQPVQKVLGTLMDLELEGMIKNKPGNRYVLSKK